MKSPKDMRIIQIDITNACIHKCSNCTRFCGHHKKNFFMDFETFKKAVQSLEGFHGIIGIMGGEPTLHPEFDRFVNYIKDNGFYPKKENLLNKPVKDFMDQIAAMETQNIYIREEDGVTKECIEGFGLWSTIGEKYSDYYELIQDTFNYQALDDHTQAMYHSPILVRREDLKIPDDEWKNIRDNCWIQNKWSATITPKGAFFCEIAGALDMLLDGPGGWKIEPGWWKRTPDQFGDQLKWCEICGIACNTFSRNANEEVDDVSEWWANKLKQLQSPKLINGAVNVLEIDDKGNISENSKIAVDVHRENHYADSYFSRYNNDWNNPRKISGLLIANDSRVIKDYISVIENNCQKVDELYIATYCDEVYDNINNIDLSESVSIMKVAYDSYGACINEVIKKANKGEFVIVLNQETELFDGCTDYLKSYVLNPGSILIHDDTKKYDSVGANISFIFSPHARVLKGCGFDGIKYIENKDEFINLWPESKTIVINKSSFEDVKYHIEPNIRYAIYGVGNTYNWIKEQFCDSDVVILCDSDCNKWGMEIDGLVVNEPAILIENKDKYDKIFVASIYYHEIKNQLISMGIDGNLIVTTLRCMFS